jgi:hypothetical protein
MHVITSRDFESKAGQEKIITTIYNLERKVHELEKRLRKVDQAEHSLERDLQ